MNKISAIGRPIDPRYPTNLAISLLVLLAFIVVAAARLVMGDAVGVRTPTTSPSPTDGQGFQAIFSKNQSGRTGASTSLRRSLPSGRIR